MASTTSLLQHPRHDQHLLEPWDFSKDSFPPFCDLCRRKISADGYACLECKFYSHRVCAEAPPRIDLHPLHIDHPLTLLHRWYFCSLCDRILESFFSCNECNFHLDIGCALSTLSDRGGTQGKTPEQIKLPFHIHALTSISIRHDFIEDINCVICKASVKGDGYACLQFLCTFLIHKRCNQNLFYSDGTKAPQIYHGHPLETFPGEDIGSNRCANCRSKASSVEFIGCAECRVFYCRDCVQVPEIIKYPHHPDHNLVLLIDSTDKLYCDTCSYFLKGMLCYGCPSCKFFVDMSCGLQVLSYFEEGMMSTKIELSWHKHPLHLCHGTKYELNFCSCCEDSSDGPMYTCKEEGCEILLHKRCTEVESTIIHPHHPDHSLTLCKKDYFQRCGACSEKIDYLKFSCELCAFYLHAKCAAHVPTRKHSLHEHELLHLDMAVIRKCNRCGTSTDSPLFRCVPCNFNLHEKCMELPPQVLNSKVHWHPLTLHETFLEDNSGEYYCEHCEKRRDGRLGVYVCGKCDLFLPRIYHIECVLPELAQVYAENIQTSAIKRMAERIALKCGQVSAAEEKLEEDKRVLDELKRELDELMKRNEELISVGVDPEDSV